MSKLITSPVPRFPGSVTLADPLTYPQLIALERAVKDASALPDDLSEGEYQAALLPGVVACVEKWELTDRGEPVDPARFPATPRKEATQLLYWLVGELMALMREVDTPPLS